MGLLDEAIREHLELKRRNGADPGEVAREEQEALEPIFPEETVAVAGDARHGLAEDEQADQELAAPEALPALDAAPQGYPPEGAEHADFASVAQETAELDMQAVLDDGLEAPGDGAAFGQIQPVRAAPAAEAREQDSLEWEMPGDAERGPPPEEIPGQERLTFE